MKKLTTDMIFQAGVVGGGGAGFPSWKKLDVQVEWLLINGAECEPLLKSDQFIMRTQAVRLVRAACAVAQMTGAKRTVFALKSIYNCELEALKSAIEAEGAPIDLLPMRPVYPAGDEMMVVREATGLTVPPGGIPLNVGCVVTNTSTLLAISEAMDEIPSTQRYVTVAGEGLTPQVFLVPVGMYVVDLLKQAGCYNKDEDRIILGGPMMGQLVESGMEQDVVVSKTTSGVLLLPSTHPLIQKREVSLDVMCRRARSVCVQCQRCTETCPRHLIGHPLQPHKIMRAVSYQQKGESASGDVTSALLCSECGLCEAYACPMGLSPRKINAALKAELREKKVQAHFELNEYPPELRDIRQINAHRIADRLGVSRYDGKVPDSAITLAPKRVSIPLKQHVGAPCVPIVHVGEHVSAGQIIGTVPENALGAPVHASVDGVVENVGQSVVIVAEEGTV